MSSEQVPSTYNVKAVVRETGIPADTLRAWERRYGVPSPHRSSGRQRLYSQQDIALLKWLLARQREGMSISRAIDLWRQRVAQGQDPAAVVEGATPGREDGQSLDDLRRGWIEACLQYSEQSAQAVLAQAFAIYPVESVCTRLLQRGLSEIGQYWQLGEATVQQEHFASNLAVNQLERLIAAAPAPSRGGRVMLACPPGEEHDFGLLLLSLLLRRRGWDTLFLGASVPLDRLDATVKDVRPSLVVLSAQQLPSAASLIEVASSLQRLGVPVAYGGLVFNLHPSLRERVPGHFLGEELSEGPQEIERLMSRPGSMSPATGGDEEHRAALGHFLSRRPLIEGAVWQELEGHGMPAADFYALNTALARNLAAALQIGDISLLGTDTHWLAERQNGKRISDDILRDYVFAYLNSARSQLDRRGSLILEWLSGLSREASE